MRLEVTTCSTIIPRSACGGLEGATVSWWMTCRLHCIPNENPFDQRRQLAELDDVTSSRANYLGLLLE